MARILTLDEIEGEPVGGKASGLARLRDMGLRVPEAVVLVGATLETPEGELDELVQKLVERFGADRVAVRSSALGEDGVESSFAGQYETVLDVAGAAEMRDAIRVCLESVENARASAYRDARDAQAEESSVPMSIVVQRMVDARVSGVCFTACPVTNRRNRLVIDAIEGLGEALVSGEASPDHEEWLREERVWEETQLAGEAPFLRREERTQIAEEAIVAEGRVGEPIDLEWAIDRQGTLQWLQARPITTLAYDPQTLDTLLEEVGDVYTRCNVGEMMPGAVSPLTYSTCAKGIDVGWQRIKDDIRLPRGSAPPRPYLGMSHGHLFINMSEGARVSSSVSGTSGDQQSLAICGRLVPEVVAPPPPPLYVRLPRLLRQAWAILRPAPRIRRMEELLALGGIPRESTGLESWRAVDARMPDLFEAYQLHLVVSSGAGALTPILLGQLAGDAEPSDEHHAIVASVLSGAKNVESADIAEGAERILHGLLAAADRSASFVDRGAVEARTWLESEDAADVGILYRAYMSKHGHRSLRELDIRQPEWAHDPTPLIRSLQTQLRGRLSSTDAARSAAVVNTSPPEGAARFDRIQKFAHIAVRNRERCKSLLVGLTTIFKRAYRALGDQLVAEGRLADADSIYFLFHVHGLLAAADRSASFVDRGAVEARTWLESEDAADVGILYRAYMSKHGHRSLRELDIRQPEWAHDPTPLIRSLQTQLRGRLSSTDAARSAAVVNTSPPEGAARFDRIQKFAHIAVRNRERCKSLLVGLTTIFKRAYRALGDQLVAEGRLADADSIYFLFHEEIETLATAPPGHALRDEALARREALAYQETLRFPEVMVGRPQPERPSFEGADEQLVIGKPVSRGRVEGIVRVVMTLEEAESLEPGEILVAPITDVGWTPYFGVISGLVTDVGSAVSHGAVVAREYGLPAVLNTRNGTSILRTGERVILDGDRGTIERLDWTA